MKVFGNWVSRSFFAICLLNAVQVPAAVVKRDYIEMSVLAAGITLACIGSWNFDRKRFGY